MQSGWTNINDIQRRFTADEVEHDIANLDEVIAKLRSTLNLLNNTIAADLNRIATKEHLWNGEAKDHYNELKRFYVMYRDDFTEAVDNYHQWANGARQLFDSINSANVMREVENA